MVQEATTDEEILATREVMRQLRPHVPFDDYLAVVKRMKQTDGYHLARCTTGKPCAPLQATVTWKCFSAARFCMSTT